MAEPRLRRTSTWVGLLFALWSGASIAGDRERGIALYTSARVWSPISYNAVELIAIDPFSLYRVNEVEWDFNVTSISNALEFDPEKTSTHRLNCKDSTIQIAGWRTSTAFTEYRGPDGTGTPARTRTTVPAGSMIAVARDYICGVTAEGAAYYWLVSWFRQGFRSPIEQLWLRENRVVVDRRDHALRSARLMFNQQPAGGLEFRDAFVRCDKHQWMEAAGSAVTLDWRGPPVGSSREIAFEKICAAAPGIIRTTMGVVSPPPSPPSAAGDPAGGAGDLERDLGLAKTKCATLGFKPGTSRFGDCVLQLSK